MNLHPEVEEGGESPQRDEGGRKRGG